MNKSTSCKIEYRKYYSNHSNLYIGARKDVRFENACKLLRDRLGQ